jgi:hypothetical protein
VRHSDGPTLPTIRITRETAHLDTARIALTCDASPRIARLVVAAFALDGAKDEAHEGSECGPRPVSTNSHIYNALWTNAQALTNASPTSAEAALVRCLTEAHVTQDTLSDKFCAAVESDSRPWAGIRKLDVWLHWEKLLYDATHDERGRLIHLVVRLLRAVGAQLEDLELDFINSEILAVIAACCGRLRFLRVQGFTASHSDWSSLCEAIITSRAPLESIDFGGNCPMEDALRLLGAVPSIVRAECTLLEGEPIPPQIAARMEKLNDEATNAGAFPCLRELRTYPNSGGLRPSTTATSLISRLRDAPLGIGDLAAAFPNLKTLDLAHVASDVSIDTMCLPATLEEIRIVDAPHADFASSIARLLARHALQLRHLARVSIVTSIAGGAGDFADITPLAALAMTLRSLTLKDFNHSEWSCERTLQVERTLSQLVALEDMCSERLRGVRCFLAGKHTRLRKLVVLSFNPGSLAALVRACPKLVSARGAHDTSGGDVFEVPRGWGVTPHNSSVSAHRLSF